MKPETKWHHGEVTESVTTQSQQPVHNARPGIVLGATIVMLVDIVTIFYYVATQTESQFVLPRLLGAVIGFSIAVFILQRLLRLVLRKTGFVQDSDWTALIIAALIYLAILLFFTFTTTPIALTPSTPTPAPAPAQPLVPTSVPVTPTVPAHTSSVVNPQCSNSTTQHIKEANAPITNPAFTLGDAVDYTGQVPSHIQAGQVLWVEGIRDNDLVVSYPIVIDNQKIIEVKLLYTPGILDLPFVSGTSDPLYAAVQKLNVNCWQQGTTAFLTQQLLHKEVRIVSVPGGGWQLLTKGNSGNDIDVSALVVYNGYGIADPYIPTPPYPLGKDSCGIEDFTYPSDLASQLITHQGMASLNNSGLWKSCSR